MKLNHLLATNITLKYKSTQHPIALKFKSTEPEPNTESLINLLRLGGRHGQDELEVAGWLGGAGDGRGGGCC
jgi:hypothetical protein